MGLLLGSRAKLMTAASMQPSLSRVGHAADGRTAHGQSQRNRKPPQRLLSLAAAALMLAGCGPTSEELAIEAAKKAISNQLIDPESAIFKPIRLADGAVCGFVNSKNRFGGYTGPTSFIVPGNFESRPIINSLEVTIFGDGVDGKEFFDRWKAHKCFGFAAEPPPPKD